jgi:hypothetical protein
MIESLHALLLAVLSVLFLLWLACTVRQRIIVNRTYQQMADTQRLALEEERRNAERIFSLLTEIRDSLRSGIK